LTPPDPQLKGAWYPRWFQPLRLSSENPVSKMCLSNATCAATAWMKERGMSKAENCCYENFVAQRWGCTVTKRCKMCERGVKWVVF
jgi:hypothetical protein